jgi:hypothetical protein
MSGYVYHVRPRSNDRFCKIGMTNGRDVESRLKELNSSSYAGFSDWGLVSVALVEDPQLVEKSFHNKYSSNKAPMGLEQEVFVIDNKQDSHDIRTRLKNLMLNAPRIEHYQSHTTHKFQLFRSETECFFMA